MVKKCAICNKRVEEEGGKLKGTMLKMKDKKSFFIYVCNDCQKQEDWIKYCQAW